jgi:hypothetical protein
MEGFDPIKARDALLAKHFKDVEGHFASIEQLRGQLPVIFRAYDWMLEIAQSCLIQEITPYRILIQAYDCHNLRPEVSLWVEKLTSWAIVEPILLQASGVFPLEAWTSRDMAETYTRHYGISWDWEYTAKPGFKASIFASLVGDTNDCKRIFKGYKVRSKEDIPKPEPLYAFDCGPGTDPLEKLPTNPDDSPQPRSFEDEIPF